jgi:hypothetical protein
MVRLNQSNSSRIRRMVLERVSVSLNVPIFRHMKESFKLIFILLTAEISIAILLARRMKLHNQSKI